MYPRSEDVDLEFFMSSHTPVFYFLRRWIERRLNTTSKILGQIDNRCFMVKGRIPYVSKKTFKFRLKEGYLWKLKSTLCEIVTVSTPFYAVSSVLDWMILYSPIPHYSREKCPHSLKWPQLQTELGIINFCCLSPNKFEVFPHTFLFFYEQKARLIWK